MIEVPTTIELPVLRGGRLVLFPGMRCEVHVRSARAALALRAAMEGKEQIAVFASRQEAPVASGSEPLHAVGTLAQIRRLAPGACCDRLVADLEGLERIRLLRWSTPGQAQCARAAADPPSAISYAIASAIRDAMRRICDEFSRCTHVRRALEEVTAAQQPEQVLGAASALLFDLPTFHRQQLLELDPIDARLEEVLAALHERLARRSHRASVRPNALLS